MDMTCVKRRWRWRVLPAEVLVGLDGLCLLHVPHLLVLATASTPLDDGLCSRFGASLHVTLPDEDAREEMMLQHAAQVWACTLMMYTHF